MTTPQSAPMSLLWVDGYPQLSQRHEPTLVTDLNLKRLIRDLSLHPDYEQYVRSVLLTLTTDLETIRFRQDVIRDLLAHPDLVDDLELILTEIITLQRYLTTPQWKENVLRQVAWRLSELERYVETVTTLHNALDRHGDKLQSTALQALRRNINETVKSEFFIQLKTELPRLTPHIRNVRSITVGINLDPEMRPLSATLVSTHTESFEGESMLARLFGFKPTDGNPLHDARLLKGIPEDKVELRDRNSPFMPALFKDLSELLDETSTPIAEALRKYTQVNSQFLIALKMEIAFYVGAVKLMRRLQDANLPITMPTPVPSDDRQTRITGMMNISLTLQHLNRAADGVVDDIVGNDTAFDDGNGRIFILTGPNQGGKTTYTQAVGLAHLMFQAGLPILADDATISPVDRIFTHFAAEERPNLEAGRLGEEARRLNDIFKHATRHSLILLNESLASTAANESLFLAQDVIRAFRLLGVRAIFATHLHELAANCDTLNIETDGNSKIVSLVSQVTIIEDEGGQTVRRTYKIIPSPPLSKSYAVELAARYGISFDQISALLKDRDVLSQ